MNKTTANVQKEIKKALRTREHYLQVMTAAYLKATQVPVEQVQLVEEQEELEDGTRRITWHFERRPEDDTNHAYITD